MPMHVNGARVVCSRLISWLRCRKLGSPRLQSTHYVSVHVVHRVAAALVEQLHAHQSLVALGSLEAPTLAVGSGQALDLILASHLYDYGRVIELVPIVSPPC